MSRVVIHRPGAAADKYDWLCDIVFNSWLGLDFECVDNKDDSLYLQLAADSGRRLHLPPAFPTSRDIARQVIGAGPGLPLAEWDLKSWELKTLTDDVVPVLFGDAGFHLDESGNGQLNLDVFRSAYFMLSRCEEVNEAKHDAHGRYPATASVAYKANFLGRPIIDEYVEILWAAIKQVWPGVERRPYRGQTIPTHDVDSPGLYAFRSASQILRVAAADSLRRTDMRTAVRKLRIWLGSRRAVHPDDPHNTFGWLMDKSERCTLKSRFYFICGQSHPDYDANYTIQQPVIRALLREIYSRGHEIGLHPSYNTFDNPERLVAEASKLKRVCAEEGIEQNEWGGRMHYLRWQTPKTLYGWEQAGMTYDSTLSYADIAGFRCGTCRDYTAFDPVGGRSLALRVRPLIAMDATIIDDRYMALGLTQEAYDEFVRLKKACQTVGGNFTFLWHNSRLSLPRQRDLYESILTA